MNGQVFATVRAVYRDGHLTVLDPLTLPDGAQVNLEIRLQEHDLHRAIVGRYPTRLVTADQLDSLSGVISAGGDALADSEALYDDDRD